MSAAVGARRPAGPGQQDHRTRCTLPEGTAAVDVVRAARRPALETPGRGLQGGGGELHVATAFPQRRRASRASCSRRPTQFDPGLDGARRRCSSSSTDVQALDAAGVAPEDQRQARAHARLDHPARGRVERRRLRQDRAGVPEPPRPGHAPASPTRPSHYGTGNTHTVWTTDAERADAMQPVQHLRQRRAADRPDRQPRRRRDRRAPCIPADGTWLFFVTVNLETGETVFSETADRARRGRGRSCTPGAARAPRTRRTARDAGRRLGSRCWGRRSRTRSRRRCTRAAYEALGLDWTYDAIEVAEGGLGDVPRRPGRVVARAVADDAAQARGAAAARRRARALRRRGRRREHRRCCDDGGRRGLQHRRRAASSRAFARGGRRRASSPCSCSAPARRPRRRSSRVRELGARRVLGRRRAIPSGRARSSRSRERLGHRVDDPPLGMMDRSLIVPSAVIATLPGGTVDRHRRRRADPQRGACCSTSPTSRGRAPLAARWAERGRHRRHGLEHAAAPGARAGAHLRHRRSRTATLADEDRVLAAMRAAVVWTTCRIETCCVG